MAADAEVKTHNGGCYCGAVSYSAKGLKNLWYCHCRQCRYLTGHFMAAASAAREDFTVKGDYYEIADGLPQYRGFTDGPV